MVIKKYIIEFNRVLLQNGYVYITAENDKEAKKKYLNGDYKISQESINSELIDEDEIIECKEIKGDA